MKARTSNIVVPADLRATLDPLQGLYGRDQSLPDILDGLNTKLIHARQVYGRGRSIALVVSGLYEQLDELRKLYDSESIEEILAGIVDRKRRLNRLVELQRKVMVCAEEHAEVQLLQRYFMRYVHNLVRQKAQDRANSSKNRRAISISRS